MYGFLAKSSISRLNILGLLIRLQNLEEGNCPSPASAAPNFEFDVLIQSPEQTYLGQEINVGPGKFDQKNKPRALNKRRARKKYAKLCYKKIIKLDNGYRPWKKIPKFYRFRAFNKAVARSTLNILVIFYWNFLLGGSHL